jgi:LEA14-like dessication related protein
MSRKKVAVVAVIVVALVLGTVGLWLTQQVGQREALRAVQISFDGADLKNVGLTSATLVIRLRMYNPNSITATLDRANYDLWGNENHLGSGVISERTDIPPGSMRTVATDFDLSYVGTAGVIWSVLKEGKVSWRITGTAYFDTPLGTMNVPFDIALGETVITATHPA